MSRSRHIAAMTCLAALVAMPLSAADIKHGQSLHDPNCNACHASLTGGDAHGLYTRSERLVTSRAGLSKQVRRCERTLGLAWFDDDIEAVAEYLNQQFYKFQP